MQQSEKSVVGASLKSVWITLLAIISVPVLSSVLSVKAYPADISVQWDYAESGAATGFAFYCGPWSRVYTSRTDIGNTDTYSFTVPAGEVCFCSMTSYDRAGAESAFSNELAISVDPDTGAVTANGALSVSAQGGQVTATATGVRVRFNIPFDPRWLNLYESEAGLEGPADLILAGATSGPVRGSLVLDEDNRGFTFVKTGGVLVPDTYTLTLPSQQNGLVDAYGRLLDGNGKGLSGDDYRLTFVVPPTDTPILSIQEFARGPGQPVNLPATDKTAGIPVRIVNGAAVREIAFTLRYNPALLILQDVSLSSSVTGALTLKSISQAAGFASIHVMNLSGLTNESTILLKLQAQVPANAGYGRQHVLDLRDLAFNGGTLGGRDDDGVHIVAYLGDTTGEGAYTSLDAQRIQRVIVQLDSGFSAYPLTDPVVLGDIDGNGRLDSTDALLIQRKVLRMPVPEIP